MLHTKIRGNLPTGSGEDFTIRVFTIYGRMKFNFHRTSGNGVGKVLNFDHLNDRWSRSGYYLDFNYYISSLTLSVVFI